MAAKAKTAAESDASDWRAATLDKMRTLIKQAVPDVVETRKWPKVSNGMRGVPVWEHDGIICTGETYKDKVKLTFAKGGAVEDPTGLFNAGLDGGTRRAIDIAEGGKINDKAFIALVKSAADLNSAGKKKR